MSQQYEPTNLTCESDSEVSDSNWSEEDEDRFCGDPEWEFSLAAIAWEARRKLYAESMIKEGEVKDFSGFFYLLVNFKFLLISELS